MTPHRTPLLLALLALLAGADTAKDEVTRVPAKQLAREYALDPVAFDKLYRDKVLEVEGTVENPRAKDTVSGDYWLMLDGFKKAGDPVSTLVRCRFIPDFKGLRAGETVRVRGKCLAYDKSLLAAQLVDCKFLGKEEKKPPKGKEKTEKKHPPQGAGQLPLRGQPGEPG